VTKAKKLSKQNTELHILFIYSKHRTHSIKIKMNIKK